MVGKASQHKPIRTIGKPSHSLIIEHIVVISHRFNLLWYRFHLHLVVTYDSFIIGVFGKSGNKEVTILRGRNYFFLVAANGCNACFMSLDQNLATSAHVNKVIDIYISVVSSYGKLCTVFINIITGHIFPVFSPYIDATFPDVPQAEYLSTAINELL